MRGYRYLYIIPILMFGLTILAAYRDNLSTSVIKDPNSIILPKYIKQRLLTENDSELLYIDYHGNNLQYYFRSYNISRCEQLLTVMRKIHLSLRYKIPQGNYLFLLHDGAHHDYGYPLLAYAAKTKYVEAKKVVLIPDPFALHGYDKLFRDIGKNIYKYPWRNKIGKIFFRGSAYGAGKECNDINGCDRFRFMNYASTLDFADVGFTSYTEQLNSKFKAKIAALHPLKENVSPIQSMAYKYLIDVDGNSCSYTRMAWILYSNSLLMKHSSDKMQWYYSLMQPYIHYLPISADFTDMQQQFLWAEQHPKQAKIIAENGRKLARKVFSNQAIMNATVQALNQYSGLVNQD